MSDPNQPRSLAERVDALLVKQAEAWRAGRQPLAEEFLAQLPELMSRPDLALKFLVEEFGYREEHGEKVDREEYRRRFPALYSLFRNEIDAPAEALAQEPAPRSALLSTERQLLFGLLAMQNGFVTRDQLVSAFGSWTADKSRELPQILQDQRALDDATGQLIAALVERHLVLHSGDARQSLAALSSIGSSSRSDLENLQDADLSASLAQLPPIDPHNPQSPVATVVPKAGLAGSRFVILHEHKEGGLGKVSVALDTELHRTVALKEIKPKYAHYEQYRLRFQREAEITGNLEHPAIVPIYGLGTYADGRPFYAMKFVRGRNLAVALDEFHQNHADPSRSTFLSVEFRQLLHRFLDVCQAVQYAHDKHVLHRDLKPLNIMLGEHGETLIIDWGLAKPLGNTEKAYVPTVIDDCAHGDSDALLKTQGFVGSWEYASPEQMAGHVEELGPATDVYALGATLYHLLTGQPPIPKGTADEMRQRILRGEFHRPRDVKHHIPRDLEAICLKAMKLQPTDRYPSAKALATDLEHWLADEPVDVLADRVSDRLARITRKHRFAVIIVLAASVLIAIGSSLATIAINQQRQVNAELIVGLEKKSQELSRQVQLANSANEATQKANEKSLQDLHMSQITRAVSELQAGDFSAANRTLQSIAPNRRGWEFDYLRNQLEGTSLTLYVPHVSSVAFSPDGKRLAGGSEKTIKLWDATTGAELLTLRGHAPDVQCFAFSADGTRLAVGCKDFTAKLWDTATGEELRTLSKMEIDIRAVALNTDGTRLAVGSNFNQIITVWDLTTGEKILTISHDSGDVEFVAFSPDGTQLASESRDAIKLWDATTGEELQHTSTAAAFNRLWDTTSAKWLLTLPGRKFTFSPDGMMVASASSTAIKLWDVFSGAELTTLRGHAFVRCVAFSPDATRLASASNDSIKLWDLTRGTGPIPTSAKRGDSISFNSAMTRLAGSENETVKLWNAMTGDEILAMHGHTEHVGCVAYSPDGKWLASGSYDSTVRLWNAETGQHCHTLQGDTNFTAVAFSPDGKTVAGGDFDGTLKLWDLTSGAELLTLRGHTSFVCSVTFSPDTMCLASACWDATVKLWDAKSGAELKTLRGHSAGVLQVIFSPDGKLLATGAYDGTVRLWNAITGEELRAPLEHPAAVLSVDFTPDGTRLASGSADQTVRIWDTKTGTELLTFRGCGSAVASVGFSSDGTRLASATGGTNWGYVRSGIQIKTWDAAPVEEVTLRGHTDQITFVDFSPDGQQLISNDKSGKTLVWRLPGGELLKTKSTSDIGQPSPAPPPPTDAPPPPSDGLPPTVWQPSDGLLPVEDNGQLAVRSPDGLIEAIVCDDELRHRERDILLIRRHPNRAPWAEDAERRMKSSPMWHANELQKAEVIQNWYAAAFHLGWLLKNPPTDKDQKNNLESRYDQAIAKLKEASIFAPKKPEP